MSLCIQLALKVSIHLTEMILSFTRTSRMNRTSKGLVVNYMINIFVLQYLLNDLTLCPRLGYWTHPVHQVREKALHKEVQMRKMNRECVD